MSRMGKVGLTLMLVGFIALLADSGLFPERATTPPVTFSEVPPATLGLPLSGWGSVSAAHIPSEASAAYGLYIYAIDPILGPLPGGTPVVITGAFPVPTPLTTVAAAAAAYTVYFDYVIPATFDGSVPEIVTATAMYLIAPPGIVVGPGDVLLRDNFDPNNFANVANGYTYTSPLTITGIIPNSGPVAGLNPATIFGSFAIYTLTTIAEADAAYAVFFGSQLASFDPATVPNVVTPANMGVIVPPSVTGLGPVDVRVVDLLNLGIEFTLVNGYTYFDPIELHVVDPLSGPLVGGQPVTLSGFFPVAAAVTSAYTAYSNYIVYFGYGNRAAFDTLVPEVITSYANPADNDMFVVSPRAPGGQSGLVDVCVIDANDINNFDCLTLVYEYLGGLGNWTGVEIVTKDRLPIIRPNDPVGRLGARELEVRLTITGTIDDAFIVPQGGDPANPAHRIELEFSTTFTNRLPVLTLPDKLEVWTNTNPIERIVQDNGAPGETSGDLFADGHAAVYLVDENGDILGNDFIFPFSDGGQIQGDALTRRHFRIDTTPPTMFVSVGGPERADDFVLQLSSGNPGYRTVDIALGPSHPFPLPSIGRQSIFDAPFDDGTIKDVPGTSNGAQIFMNVASLANNFVDEPLRIQVDVRFVDLSVHDTFRIGIGADPPEPPDPIDVDRFDPLVTTRQVSGFDTRPLPDGDFPGGTLFLPSALFPEVTVRARLLDSAHVQWVYAAGSDKLSPTGATTVTTDHTILAATDTGFFADTKTTLDTRWVVSGIPQRPDKLHLALQFRAHDWAGSWTDVSGSNTKTDFTDADRQLDPLHIWWLRNTATRLFPNREGSEVFDPTFTLRLDNGFNTNSDAALQPLFSFRVFVRNVPGKGAYNLPDPPSPVTDFYRAPDPWNIWTTTSAIGSGPFAGLENNWVLLVAVNTDEAGNVENWPDDLILDVTENDILQINAGSGRNWQRFFLKAQEQQIETELTAFFWHNDVPANNQVDVGELAFGETHVIPLPPKSAFDPNDPVSSVLTERVEARFVIRAVTEIANPDITWELLREGTVIAASPPLPLPVLTNSIATVVLPLNGGGFGFLGDRDRRRAISYVFRATTVAGGFSDSTPANFHFTVVPSVQGFIENRQSDDEQPIKVFERQ